MQWITLHDDEIGHFPRCHCANVLLQSQTGGGVCRGRLERLHGRHTGLDQTLEFLRIVAVFMAASIRAGHHLDANFQSAAQAVDMVRLQGPTTRLHMRCATLAMEGVDSERWHEIDALFCHHR